MEEFKNNEAWLRQWKEKNRLSQLQSQRGEAKPLDDEAVLARLRERLMNCKNFSGQFEQ